MGQVSFGSQELHRPETVFDVLHIPLIGNFLRWKWGRLAMQAVTFLLAALIIYDGFTGPQLASSNNATLLAWVHYRGLVVLALLLAGNLFCMGCPFTVPRTLAKKLSVAGGRWPRALRNKWVAISGLLLIFLLYEWLDLWASPWLTAWIAVAYFVGSFVLEALFTESAFCKYVCPLGAFNFVYSTASPLQIGARDQSVCRNCEGKECINGGENALGCGTELFVPMIESNMDCTMCLDCARACPYDNVALRARAPWRELLQKLPARWDLAFLIVALSFFGFFNAFGMVPPVYALQSWLGSGLGLRPEVLQLLLIFTLGGIVVPAIVLLGCSWLSQQAGSPLDRVGLAAHFAPAFVPLGLGIWFAHYFFHFAIGALTIIPVMQSFLLDHGVSLLGTEPRWDIGFLLPADSILPIQTGALVLGFFGSLAVLAHHSLQAEKRPLRALVQMLPWALVLTGLVLAALNVFNLPMEMRGAVGA